MQTDDVTTWSSFRSGEPLVTKYVLAAVLISAVSVSALADPDTCPPRFEDADVNSDGVLTSEETARTLGWNFNFFTVSDENKDGVVDRREFEKLGFFCKDS
jgi:hypothetical protein